MRRLAVYGLFVLTAIEITSSDAPFGAIQAVSLATLLVAATFLAFGRSTVALSLGALSQLADALDRAPQITNHAWLFLSIHLVWLAWRIIDRLRPTSSRQDAMVQYRSLLIGALTAFYFWAAFHKLNTDFFFGDSSCVSWTLQAVLRKWDAGLWSGLAPASQTWIPIGAAATVLLEFTAPLLAGWAIAGSRAKQSALIAVLIFHGCLLGVFPSISIHMAWMWFAILSPPGSDKARQPRRELLLIAGFCLAFLVTSVRPFPFLPSFSGSFFEARGWVLAVIYASFAWLAFRSSGTFRPVQSVKFAWTAAAVVTLVAIQPYIGGRTLLVYSMYSNLRTEGDRTNHWLIPASVQLTSDLRDLVPMTSSPDHPLLNAREPGLLIPKIWNDTLIDPNGASLWQNKWRAYRPVESSGPARCRW